MKNAYRQGKENGLAKSKLVGDVQLLVFRFSESAEKKGDRPEEGINNSLDFS